MNKLSKDKWMGIATPVSLVLALVLSSNVFAGPGKGKGPQSSISVFSVCHIVDNGDASMLVVDTTVTDKSSGTATAEVASAGIQGEQKVRGPNWSPLGDGAELSIAADSTTVTVALPICEGAVLSDPLEDSSKAINALVTVYLKEPSNNDMYTSRCKDDPATEYVNEAILKVADYTTLCNP
ncbi:MAG: hypothetical protein OEO82_02535 [Gammaproteobacteria bacterium]|nr:hypothetical protein [Gammaproteobacteria bacterium]